MNEGDLIDQAVGRLKGPAPPNEAAVRNSPVLPVLRALGWNTDDWNQVGQEMPIKGWAARDRAQLYDRSDLCEEDAERVGNSWWLGTNCSNGEKMKRLQDMRAVARMRRLSFKFKLGDTR